MNFNIFGKSPWSMAQLSPPWKERPSIYWHIVDHVREDSCGLREEGHELPDEKLVRGDSSISWAPGAMDGVFGHHVGSDEATEKKVQDILQALKELTRKSSDKNAARLYSLMVEGNSLSVVDPLLEAITTANELDHDRLQTVALWLAMEAPDRDAVKIAIAIVGLFRGSENRDVLMTLGKHEEFTLYSVVALQNTQDDWENALWQLAQHVRGWGRIHIIERLSGTEDTYIRDWMLKEGYENDIMYEYTALTCAQTGGLRRALEKPVVDEDLLKGAGQILSSLIDCCGGGPAEGIESYKDGPDAAVSYLRHLSQRDNDIEALVSTNKIELFLTEGEDGVSSLPDEISAKWLSKREDLLILIKSINAQSGWEGKVRSGLKARERLDFWTATQGARILGIDVWEIYFERIQDGEDHWWNAMQTDDPERVERLIGYAERTLPLGDIATGAGEELGLGEKYQAHQTLDWILQDLRRFPGKGWVLIQTGLRSPVVRNRNMAVNALAGWGRDKWPKDAEELLRAAYNVEPSEQTKQQIKKVLDGEKIS